jgi:hypothetical protein
MKSLVAYLNGETITNLPEIKAELEAELAKDADAKAAKVAEYDEIREAVFSVLGDAPMTVAEIFNACGDKLPEGCSKNKVQYGLLNYWKDEVVKVEQPKGPNQYRRA